MKIRSTFPAIYKLTDKRTGYPYWLVDCRSKKWGMTGRPTFNNEKDAKAKADAVAEQVAMHGAQPHIPAETKSRAKAYEKLAARLAVYGKTPEEATEHFLTHLGKETLRAAKPIIRILVEQWEAFEKTDTTLKHKSLVELRSYARFIRSWWGDLKPDDLMKNQIDLKLRGLKVSNNTRRKYLKYIRRFFAWAKDEHVIDTNPTDGIFFKAEEFEGEMYDLETTKKLLQYVAEHEKDLLGYYALLTFAGLRPDAEGPFVEWKNFSFKTNELYVKKTKVNARRIILEPVAVEWMKLHRANIPEGNPSLAKYAYEDALRAWEEAVKAIASGS